MTCLSDIDLATLHKSRLEERLNYKLAWGGATTNRLSAYQQHHHHHTIQQQQHACMNTFQAAPKATARSRNAAQKQKQQQKSTKTTQQQRGDQQQQQTQQTLDSGLSALTRSSPERNTRNSSKSVTDDLLNGNCVELTDKLQHLNLHFDDDLLDNGHPKVQHKSRKSCAGDGRLSSRLLDDDRNCNYFTATTRRRRSGTWP